MNKKDWRSYIYKVVTVILVIFFVTGVGFGAKKILSIEGTRELYEAPAPRTPLPQTEEEIVQYINLCIENALAACPKTQMSSSFSVNASSVQSANGNAQMAEAVRIAVPGLNSRVKALFETNEADYFQSAAQFLQTCIIDKADIESATVSYEYYRCSLCTSQIAYDKYDVVCPECGSENTLQLRSADTYKISVRIRPDTASFTANPFPKAEALTDVIEAEGGHIYTLQQLDKQFTDITLYAEINRLTDSLQLLRFESIFSFDLQLAMNGDFAILGTDTISATATDRVNYNFTWPSLQLDKHEMTVELGSSEVLKAKLTCDDPLLYDVVWTSSDESVLTVDSEGYLKTNKVFGDSVITATFTFNGKEYSDACLVHVGVPAEGVDLNKGKLSLKTGETAELKAVFNPKDTTNTLCYWYSENEAVATVDENGVVTAVAPGKTVIYIISDYGNYYSSCETEVTD